MSDQAQSTFFVETLGCPKNAVDSDKVVASLLADGLVPTARADDADLVVVNTCAFIEAARQESVEIILALGDTRKTGSRLVVTGCMAERYGDELAAALPEVDAVVGFAGEGALGTAVAIGAPRRKPVGVRDLLELPRPAPTVPWAYLKVAEGCDRACAFCAIPSFRGTQRSRTPESIEAEARQLVEGGVAELVLVAQDLAWYGRDIGEPGSLAPLLRRLESLAADGLTRVRLLYLYPSEVRDPLVATMLELPTVVPYFDLSLQHADPRLLRRMKRWGSGDRFLAAIDAIRARGARRRVPVVVHRRLPGRDGTRARRAARVPRGGVARLGRVLPVLARGRHAGGDARRRGRPRARVRVVARVRGGAGAHHARARDALVGREIEVLVDALDDASDEDRGTLIGRTHREAPEIDGIVRLHADWARPGATVRAHVTEAIGPDLIAKAAGAKGARG